MSEDMAQQVLAIFREEALELVQRTLAALNRAANGDAGERAKHIQEVCRLLHTLKGAAAAVDHEEINRRAHALEDRIAELPAGAEPKLFDSLFRELELIESQLTGRPSVPEKAPVAEAQVAQVRPAEVAVRAASEARPAPARDLSSDAASAFTEWLRVPPERIDQLHAQLGELVLARLQHDQLVDRMVHLRTAAAHTMTKQRELSRVLVDVRSELSPETFRRLQLCTQSVASGFSAFLDSLQGVCRDARMLQAQSAVVSQGVEESIQGLRLMPLGPFFEGFAKSARDAARRADRKVRFHVKADGAEVDRAVLTRLHDALLHLVRNAVVHGIESADERLARGKPEEGSLTLEAWSAGTHAVIRVLDDGAGVDVERVRKKAQALGIGDSDDILEILTHPGFSTRDSADDLAGRGVGLDVVYAIVRGLHGTLELGSERGTGSVFTIRVPIAASTTMGLILEVGRQRFGLMLSEVERVLRPAPEDIERVEGRPAVHLGDELVALVALADLLGVETEEAESGRIPVVVIRHGRRRLALAVSAIPGEHALVVRPFGRAFRGAEMFVGGAVQPDHSVVPVISTSSLFARAARSSQAALTRHIQLERPRAKTMLHALVVDDSITMRTLLRNVLQASGYQVAVAEDGLSALAQLDDMPECHIVVTDLQMPRMDGIELCRSIRGRDGSYVPIVMVTSVDDDEEKSRALAAGADAYVVKSSFEQVTFLKRVDTLVRGPV